MVQRIWGVEVIGEADTYEEALELSRCNGAACAWAVRMDRKVPRIVPRKPSAGRSWKKEKAG